MRNLYLYILLLKILMKVDILICKPFLFILFLLAKPIKNLYKIRLNLIIVMKFSIQVKTTSDNNMITNFQAKWDFNVLKN